MEPHIQQTLAELAQAIDRLTDDTTVHQPANSDNPAIDVQSHSTDEIQRLACQYAKLKQKHETMVQRLQTLVERLRQNQELLHD